MNNEELDYQHGSLTPQLSQLKEFKIKEEKREEEKEDECGHGL